MILLYGVLAGATLAVCLLADRIGHALNIVDRPDGRRKVHRRETPLVGGIAIALPIVAFALVQSVTTEFTPFYLVIGLTVSGFFALGLVDDRGHVPPVARLAFAIGASAMVFEIVPAFVVTFLKFTFLPVAIYLGDAAAVGFTLLCIVGLQNAINMADGQNGLVIGLSLLWTTLLYAVAPGHLEPILLALGLALAVALPFNLAGRLFLGDSGAYALSVLLALLAIYVYRTDFAGLPADMVALWFLIPVVDCLRLMLIRVVAHRSPLRPDRNHFHHRLNRIVPWSASLVVYLTLVAVPSWLALAFPAQTPALAVGVLLVYGTLLAMTTKAEPQASTEPPVRG